MSTSDVANIDPVEAKAFELRQFAIEVRRKLTAIEDVDRLRELEIVLHGAGRRLRQLKEDVVEAERTRVLVVQRIGVLLGPAHKGPSASALAAQAAARNSGTDVAVAVDYRPVTQSDADRDYQARMIAAYPSIVEQEIAAQRVSVNRVFRLCRAERAREAREAAAAAQAARPAYDVQPGQWWALGDHRLYCGDSRDAGFIEKVRKAEPVFAFADPPMDPETGAPLWTHDYLGDMASVVAVTPGIANLVDFAQRTGMSYRWMIAAHVFNAKGPGALGYSTWIPVYLYAREETSLFHEAEDHFRTGVDPHTTDEIDPAQKPLSLMAKLLDVFTSSGDIVVDPFLGSGTTLIAADRERRVCIAAENDLALCGQILMRFGREVTLL